MLTTIITLHNSGIQIIKLLLTVNKKLCKGRFPSYDFCLQLLHAIFVADVSDLNTSQLGFDNKFQNPTRFCHRHVVSMLHATKLYHVNQL